MVQQKFIRQTCKWACLPRSSVMYKTKSKDDNVLTEALQEMVHKHPAFGKLSERPIVDFENEQNGIAKKRMEKLNERLVNLQSMKSKLKAIKGAKSKTEERKRA